MRLLVRRIDFCDEWTLQAGLTDLQYGCVLLSGERMMLIKGNLQAFSRDDIEQAPDEPGVYGLYQGDDLIYIGRAEGGLSITTIRARLKSHCQGYRGPNTEHATHYRCEVNRDPVARQRKLLQAYEQRHGRLPRCNTVSYLGRTRRVHNIFDLERTVQVKGGDARWKR
ncbi:MAG: hypothetical protein ACE5HM_06775 [Acidiferrobacterales bacterium]